MSKSCTRALAGKVVYALHKKYADDRASTEKSQKPAGKSTVGIYSTAKAARIALRTTMAKEVFDTDKLPQPAWADFYVGPVKQQKAAIKRLLHGEPDAEDAFDFPWDEPWRSDGTIAFQVCNLTRDSNYEDETDSDESDEDSEEDIASDDEADSDEESSIGKDSWACEDGDDGYYYEIEAILIR